MWQAVEAQVLNPHCELGEQGLKQILTDVIEEVRRSISQDIDGAHILRSLLNASWLQSLLKVYECLQRYLKTPPVPALDYASGLSVQLLIELRALHDCSEEAKELYRLMRQPHIQALLSAHDSVAKKDYEPVLPEMPEDLPDDEEATRIVCLVKNKQPLFCSQQTSGQPCGSCQNSSPLKIHMRGQSQCFKRLYNSPGPVRCGPRAPQAPVSFHMSCRSSSTHSLKQPLLWEHPAPSLYNSAFIDDMCEQLDRTKDLLAAPSSPVHSHRGTYRWHMSQPSFTVPCCSRAHHCLPPRFQTLRSHIHTAPPSPLYPRRVGLQGPRVELVKQESLNELRSCVQRATSCMESSTRDLQLLGDKMTTATDRMSQSVQDSSQALVLLTQAVDRLQLLLASKDLDFETSSVRSKRPSLKHQACISAPSLPSSLSSFNSSQDAPLQSTNRPPTQDMTPKTNGQLSQDSPTDHQSTNRASHNNISMTSTDHLSQDSPSEPQPNQVSQDTLSQHNGQSHDKTNGHLSQDSPSEQQSLCQVSQNKNNISLTSTEHLSQDSPSEPPHVSQSCHSSPHITVRNNVQPHPLTNGVLESPYSSPLSLRSHGSKRRRKRRKRNP